ncbi:hypothetical protein HALLA_08515 [Halostagnicola larsenii XH-48]|uniref:DUF7344 domain-containing protein n=1 Tax=Halostagnicola larsenii XH-48 TaxID=797299 RepID=W0JJX2_9EURY|nr:hypothetical protein [Halostagnicola larsenii]AHF98898.1 hypothetical protein HALLA_08515 [Halostagnicola larsenii XH-48]
MTLQTDRPRTPEEANPSHPNATATSPLSRDAIFHLLQTSRRRETIRYLLEANGPVKMREVAEHVAAREHETTVEQLRSTERQRVYIPLYQSHLPKLDKNDVIDYDQSRGVISPGTHLELFRPYFEVSPRSSDDSNAESERPARPLVAGESAYYGTLTALAVSSVVASADDAFAIPDGVVLSIIGLLFASTILLFTRIGRIVPTRLDRIDRDDLPFTDQL